MNQGDGGDFQIHGAQPKTPAPDLFELFGGSFVEGNDLELLKKVK